MGCSSCGGGGHARQLSTRQSTSGRLSMRTTPTANERRWTVNCPDGTETTVRGEGEAHRVAARCGGTYAAK